MKRLVPAIVCLSASLASGGDLFSSKIEPLLTDYQKGVVIGCGAMLMHYGKAETIAGIHAAMALQRARTTP